MPSASSQKEKYKPATGLSMFTVTDTHEPESSMTWWSIVSLAPFCARNSWTTSTAEVSPYSPEKRLEMLGGFPLPPHPAVAAGTAPSSRARRGRGRHPGCRRRPRPHQDDRGSSRRSHRRLWAHSRGCSRSNRSIPPRPPHTPQRRSRERAPSVSRRPALRPERARRCLALPSVGALLFLGRRRSRSPKRASALTRGACDRDAT